jgi:hypothetical protein
MASEPEIYVFRTALTAAQTAEALRSSMDESELDFIFRVGAEGHRPIIGNADNHECRLMRRPGLFSNDYAGIFSAAIFEEWDCTRLDGQFVRVQFGFPLGSRNSNASSTTSIKIGILFLIGFQAYNIIGSFMEADHPILNPPSIFAGALLVAMCASYSIAIRAKKQQREFILRHVKAVLNASLSR